ncbi:MAG TPA: alpha/beta fold hydrolase, partial [Anaerolineales bacterium]
PTSTPGAAELLYPYTIEGLRQHAFQGGKITLLSEPEETKVYTRYRIAYPSDGLRITGILQIPREGKPPFPVIILNHGFFARSVYHSGDGTDRAAEYFNQRGYLTLSSDYRSWGNSDIGPSLFYSGLVTDVVNLVLAVPSIPQADPGRIGMWGHSMGGGVTMKVLMLKTPVRAAVLYSPVSADDADLVQRWGMGCIGDISEGENSYGCNSSDILPYFLSPPVVQAYQTAASRPEMLSEFSPFYHLDLVSVPVQIHYGLEDGKTYSGTPPDWSRKLYEALVRAGAQAELFGYDGQGHSFRADSWFAFMERSSHFFDQTVKGAS